MRSRLVACHPVDVAEALVTHDLALGGPLSLVELGVDESHKLGEEVHRN